MTATRADTFRIGDDLLVHRLGFGGMRLAGPGVWGFPADRPAALAVLRRAVELGVDLIDTADAYGPEVNEYQIADALHPYPAGLVVATKGGCVRGGPGDWGRDGRPEHITRAIANSLRRLRIEALPLYQLHAADPAVPLSDTVGALARARERGLVRHVGLCNVDVGQVQAARSIVPIVTVQNRYNLYDRGSEAVLQYCARERLGFIPWYPLGTGKVAQGGGALSRVAAKHGATPAQTALAWLMNLSDVVLPIPGTSSITHLEENLGAARIRLDADDMRALGEARA